MLGWLILLAGVLAAVALGRWAERHRRVTGAGAWSDLCWPAGATLDPEDLEPPLAAQLAVAPPVEARVGRSHQGARARRAVRPATRARVHD